MTVWLMVYAFGCGLISGATLHWIYENGVKR